MFKRTYIKIHNFVNWLIVRIYFTLFRPWATAIAKATWNSYLKSNMYKERVRIMGIELAKEQFFHDDTYVYYSYRKLIYN